MDTKLHLRSNVSLGSSCSGKTFILYKRIHLSFSLHILLAYLHFNSKIISNFISVELILANVFHVTCINVSIDYNVTYTIIL